MAAPFHVSITAASLASALTMAGLASPALAAEPGARPTESSDSLSESMLGCRAVYVPPARVGFRLDTDALGDDAEPIADKVTTQAKAMFERESITAPLDALDPVIVVVVEPAPNDEAGYVIGLSIEQDGSVVPGSAKESACALCSRTELIDRIDQSLPELLALARQHQAKRAGEPIDDVPDPVVPTTRKLGPLGFGGIGLSVAGIGIVAAGVGLAVQGVVPDPDEPGSATNYRTPGNALLVVGGVALIGGLVMIGVDVSRRKKARARERAGVRWEGVGFAF